MSGRWPWRAVRAMLPLVASIRVRLTVWYVAILAVVLVVFSGSVYAAQARSIESDAHGQLRAVTQQLAATYDSADGLIHPGVIVAKSPKSIFDFGANRDGSPPIPASTSKEGETSRKNVVFLLEQSVVLLLDRQGRVIQRLGPSLDQAVGDQLLKLATLARGETFLSAPVSESSGGKSLYLFHATPLVIGNADVGTLVVGQPDPSADQLAELRLALLLAAPATLLVAALGGYWLAARAMRPVRLIGQAAAEIGATDLGRRLRLQQRDELGALAATFDGMLDRLEASFARQRQFTADASHELRTPLSIVDLEATHALASPRTPEEYARALATIQAENARMSRLVNDLLVLARVDAGHAPSGREPLDLGDLALAVVERLEPLARRCDVALHTGDLPEIPVVGDRHHLTQLLTNLVENGIVHTGGHGTRVCVTAGACRDTAPAHAWLRVADDGPGIAPDDLPHLFERFYRADRARTRDATVRDAGAPGGSGLGLAIVAWVAQAHGGQVSARSTPGQGATFELRLPLE